MKYYKYDNGFGKQPSNIIPPNAMEITAEEYLSLQTAFNERQKAIAGYTAKVKAGELALTDVPQEYFTEVEAIVNAPELEPFDERQALIDEIIAEVNK